MLIQRVFTGWNIGFGLLGAATGAALWLTLRWGYGNATPAPRPEYDEPRAYAELGTLDDELPDAGSVAAEAPEPGLEAPKMAASAELHPVLGHTLNVLLLGLDKNPGVRKGGLTDTLIIAALDTERERLGLVSVPRDLFVSVPNHGETRVNAVYALARRDKLEPTAAFDRVLRDTLGVPIHHTVVVDLGLFERVVDELGGVDVQVPCAIKDRFLDGRVEGGRRMLDVAAGNQHLDGVTAAMYVRSRHGRSDWSRARRQQAVLLGLRDKVTQPETLLHVPELLSEWSESVTTDLSSLQLLRLVKQVATVKVENLHGVVLGHKETLPVRTDKNWSVLMANNEAISERLDGVYEAGLPGHGTERCVDPDVALRYQSKERRKSKALPESKPLAVKANARN
jgi:LCP family protein required for cell wall assembly